MKIVELDGQQYVISRSRGHRTELVNLASGKLSIIAGEELTSKRIESREFSTIRGIKGPTIVRIREIREARGIQEERKPRKTKPRKPRPLRIPPSLRDRLKDLPQDVQDAILKGTK